MSTPQKLSLLFIALFVCGCASFPGKYPKHSYPSPEIDVIFEKPSVDYTVEFFHKVMEITGWEYEQGLLWGTEEFRKKVHSVLTQSNMFSEIYHGKGNADFHFSFALYQYQPDFAQLLFNGVLSVVTLGLFPLYIKVNYIMTVDIYKDGNYLKQYNYKNYRRTWGHLFLIPLSTSHSAGKITEIVINDMLVHFLSDIHRDGLLKRDYHGY